MDIFAFAIEKEHLAREHYLKLAEKTSQTGLKTIFQMLADEESKHVEAIEKLKAQDRHEVADSPVLQDAKAVFQKMRDGAKKFNFDISERQLYEKARQIEANARDFYLEKAKDVEIDWQKNVFRKLAEEEQKHYRLMDNICELVARPDTWLEDAEFTHLEDY